MSLLTEEQMAELTDVLWERQTLVSWHLIATLIREWNEKQTGIQVKPNWDLAPKEATSADVKIQWRGVENAWTFEAIFANIPRPTTPHPHADIIAKYAEVAARRCDPWVEFEWTSGEVGSEDWKVCHEVNTGFNYGRRYRHIGDKP